MKGFGYRLFGRGGSWEAGSSRLLLVATDGMLSGLADSDQRGILKAWPMRITVRRPNPLAA